MFDTVLVANRGEIASRIFRSASDMGHRTVAVFVEADADAPFVTEADEAFRVSSYLDVEAVTGVIEVVAEGRSGVAVHPGYGFLAENAAFARAVTGAGAVWVGPSAEAIEAMGDKIEAKKLARSADVPTLESTHEPARFADIGFPLLIKAAAGGGGKGMRIVDSSADLDDAVASAKREALSGFADDRVFAERYVGRARHIEIQILGDEHGGLVHLGERECSIQRRHQKIIEESPSPFATPELRESMGASAVRLAAELQYRSAGTVEFLVDDATGDYFFLEVNTRLQVEHPVTEEVTGIDLVREQLRIAAGQPLGYDQSAISITGHAIEARLYAEDPASDFLPATGTLDAFAPADRPRLRWDTGVTRGSVIVVDFDPMVAKVISHGPTRVDAAGRLALGLERLALGGVSTNRDFLSGLLRSPEFLAGDTTTDFIERVDPARTRPVPDGERRLNAVAAALWIRGENRGRASVNSSVPAGFLIGRLPPETVDLRIGDETLSVYYSARRDGSLALGPDGSDGTAVVHDWWQDGIDVEIDGRRRRLVIDRSGETLHLGGPGGGTTVTVVPRFAQPEAELPGGAVVAPMPGQVVEIRVETGQQVAAGDVVIVLEAMKMENHLRAAEAGTVADVSVSVGDQVEKDVLLVVIDGADSTD